MAETRNGERGGFHPSEISLAIGLGASFREVVDFRNMSGTGPGMQKIKEEGAFLIDSAGDASAVHSAGFNIGDESIPFRHARGSFGG